MIRAATIREKVDLRAGMSLIEAHTEMIRSCTTEKKLGKLEYNYAAKKSIEFGEVWSLENQEPQYNHWHEQFERAKAEWEAIKEL